jgi:fructose-bisphosphate aldolase class 1
MGTDLGKTAQALVANGTGILAADKAWHGNSEDLEAGQRAFYHRAKCTSAAARCRYSRSMESELVIA